MTALNPEPPQTPPEQPQVDAKSSQQTVDTTLVQQPVETAKDAIKDESTEDPNWRAFREARKKDRLEREAAEQKAAEKEREVAALKAAMEAAFTKQQAPSTQAYQDYYAMNQQPEETEEQRIERKVNEMLSKKEEQYKQQQADYERQTYPQRLLREMPDFNQVCSQENLDYLDFHFPEVSRPLQRLGDGYDKWSDTYAAVKKFIPNHSTAKREAMKADINTNKPRSMSSSGPSPTGEPVRQTWQEAEERKAANWARMQRVLKGV